MNLLLKKKKKEQKTIDLDKLMLEKIIIKKLMFLIQIKTNFSKKIDPLNSFN